LIRERESAARNGRRHGGEHKGCMQKQGTSKNMLRRRLLCFAWMLCSPVQSCYTAPAGPGLKHNQMPKRQRDANLFDFLLPRTSNVFLAQSQQCAHAVEELWPRVLCTT